MKESGRGILGFIGVIVLIGLIAILVLTQIDDDSEKTSQIPVEERSPAHELAIFAAGEYVSEDDPRVKEFEQLLASIAENTSDSKREIGKLSTETLITLREEEDVELTLLDYLKKAEELARESDSEIPYQEVISKLEIIFTEEGSEA